MTFNRADRRKIARDIRRGIDPVKILWPKFPSPLLFALMVRAGIIQEP